jgi:hypothetical protein
MAPLVWLALMMSSVLPFDAKAIPRFGFFTTGFEEDELDLGEGEGGVIDVDVIFVLDVVCVADGAED